MGGYQIFYTKMIYFEGRLELFVYILTCSLDIGFRHMLFRSLGFGLVPVWVARPVQELAYILLIFIYTLKVCWLLTLWFNRFS